MLWKDMKVKENSNISRGIILQKNTNKNTTLNNTKIKYNNNNTNNDYIANSQLCGL